MYHNEQLPMSKNYIIHPDYKNFEEEIVAIIASNESNTDYLAKGTRNSIKKSVLSNGKIVTTKSFKIPNVVNKIVYRFFRESKAERSFTYAQKIIDYGFLTPHPIAYFENRSILTFKDSYYLCELVEADLTYRELVTDEDYPNRDLILEQFTGFTFDLHEKGIEFLDHSPGNTLIVEIAPHIYDFYLVDLNRMKFHDEMDFDTRMKNFARLTPKKEMIEKMAATYAPLIGKEYEDVFSKMWGETVNFQARFQKKQATKAKFKKMIGKG